MTAENIDIRALAARFPSFQERCYARGKLSTDPLYPAVFEALKSCPEPLLDIGCGMGLLAFYLRERGWSGHITGIDYDARKIKTAIAVAGPEARDLDFSQADAMDGLPDHSGSVTILDILQYFPAPERAVLLRAAAARVCPGGRLVIRTGLAGDTWRCRVTRSIDLMAAAVRWMKSPPLHYPDKEETESLLAAAGLIGAFRPLWGNTPFNNWMGVFDRYLNGGGKHIRSLNRADGV